jgi:hypothetical protein
VNLCEEIGVGSTANIFKGIWHGLDVAVKCMKLEYFIADKVKNKFTFFT